MASHNHPDFVGDTEIFYKKYFKDLPSFDNARLQFRKRFLEEEFLETMHAIETRDAEGVVDGLIDYIVVALGTLREAGVDIATAWDTVHLANMRKLRNPNPSRFGSAGFDLVKPPGWEGPSHDGNHGALDEIFKKEQEKPFDSTDRD